MKKPTYAEVLKVISSQATKKPIREAILAGFRAGDGDRNRWNTFDMAAMARAITACEDAAELAQYQIELRTALRDIRRRLEDCSDSAATPKPYIQIAQTVRRVLGEPEPEDMRTSQNRPFPRTAEKASE